MDPITGAAVALALFVVSIPLAWFVAFLVGFFLLAAEFEVAAGLWVFLSPVLAIGWTIFAIIQGVIQLIQLLNLLT